MKEKPKFIVRCSQIGNIMTDPKEKSNLDQYNEATEKFKELQSRYADTKNKETKTAYALFERMEKYQDLSTSLYDKKDSINVSKTCLDVIDEWMKLQLGYPSQGFSNKYTEKGLLMESGAIEMVSNFYGWHDVKKNTERQTNEFITGEWDIERPDRIVDIKCSFSSKTFPLRDTVIPIDGYGYQGLGYMDLRNKDLFQLTYALMNTPEYLIDSEARRVQYKLGLDDLSLELYKEVEKQHIYDHMPIDFRIKSFFIEYDKEIIESVYSKIELCRKYIDQSGFYEQFEKRWFNN